MPTSEFEWEYNGFTFGAGTGYEVIDVEGLDPPEIKFDINQVPGAPGAWTWGDQEGERHVIITGDYGGDSTTVWNAMQVDWTAAFAPQTTEIPLHFNFPTWGAHYINCKPLNRDYKTDGMFSTGYVLWVVELVSELPNIYDDV